MLARDDRRPRRRPPPSLLATFERYYDAVPRGRARAEEVGPFTLFVADGGWPLLRPAAARAGPTPITARRRTPVCTTGSGSSRCRARSSGSTRPRRGSPSRSRRPRSRSSGAPCWSSTGSRGPGRHGARARPGPTRGRGDLRTSRAAVSVGFDNPGTRTGAAGLVERDQALTAQYADLHDVVAGVDASRPARLRPRSTTSRTWRPGRSAAAATRRSEGSPRSPAWESFRRTGVAAWPLSSPT